jgi:uncharacterized protein
MSQPTTKGPGEAVSKEQFESVRSCILPQLKNELPSHFTYHNVAHTQQVIDAANCLLQKEGVSEADRWLLLTAAVLHDAGFLRSYSNHESHSCAIAGEMLPRFHFTKGAIETICQLIMATKMPQNPGSHYAEILCDADLFYLGESNFAATSENLFKELKAVGKVKTEEEWKEKQRGFLASHHYFTNSAKSLLEPNKQALIRQLYGTS